MSVDSGRIETAVTCINYMWSGPMVILVIIGLLCRTLGWYAFVGLAFLIAFMPLQNKIFKSMSKYRQLATKHSDERIKKMQEALYGIRVIKFYCWEESILETLVSIRKLELSAVTKIILVKTSTATITAAIPTLSCILTFLVYSYFGKKHLDPETVIKCLFLFGRLKMPLFLVPKLASFVADGRVALKRVQDYLQAEELDFSPKTDLLSNDAVLIENGNFDWNVKQVEAAKETTEKAAIEAKSEKEAKTTTTTDGDGDDASSDSDSGAHFTGLHNVQLKLPRGKLIAVVGAIGSGKSSLLNALVGEMRCSPETKIVFSGSVGYSPQQAWIQNATIRENITFGRPFSAKLYHAVLKACALEKDLRLFPDGDQTEIGEKGTNLSGGQKQRINLARLAYSDADIVLMDDPLSAVDAHVGRHLFQHLLCSFLKHKTRILVTHQLHFLKGVDYVLVMKDGVIEAVGTYHELLRTSANFRSMIAQTEDGGGGGDGEGEQGAAAANEEVSTSPIEVSPSPIEDQQNNLDAENEDTAKSCARLMAREERTYGAVSMRVFLEYVRFAGGVPIASLVIAAAGLLQLSRMSSDIFGVLKIPQLENKAISFAEFGTIYVILGLSVAVSGALFSVILSLAGLVAGRRLFRESTLGVLRAPTVFFDTNPVGRIINRFSKDQDAIDNLLPESLRGVLSTFASICATLVFICIKTSVYVAVLLVPLLFAYYHYQNLYRNASRELKRLDNLTKSPLIAQFSETLTGLPTIRAYGRQAAFEQRNAQLLDANNQPVFLQISAERWAANRLEAFGAIFALAAMTACLVFNPTETKLMGIATMYALEISVSLNWGVRQLADMEAQIVSTERLSHYANNLPQEGKGPVSVQSGKEATATVDTLIEAPADWPQAGAIEFQEATLSYRPDLPPVLNECSISIKAGERVGIVGRTGAGKSSLLMALFRMTELSAGQILIDGQDIRRLALKQVRSHLSIIPQDPVIFSGTVRSNLDPFGVYSDSQIWDALERAHLKHFVAGLEGKLEGEIAENGENLSVGQRQLLCLARALLKKNKILVLDEATANIDLETDALVQKCIRKDFAGCTILTIAHRLNTVIDYDKILVLDAGRVMEFDSPYNLLSKPHSEFAQLCAETGESNERVLKMRLNLISKKN
jgi:ATP-binding cassette subfamily C (CFTR/MRP) protein 1